MASKDIEKMRSRNVNGLFRNNAETTPGTEERPPRQRRTPTAETRQKSEGTNISVWVSRDTRDQIKAMSKALDKSVSGLVTEAVCAYITDHEKKMSPEQKTIYTALLKMSQKHQK